jgi:hypothetical protein
MRARKLAKTRSVHEIPFPEFFDLWALCDSDDLGSAYPDDDARRADYEAHRTELLATAERYGNWFRPSCFWRFDGGRELLRSPGVDEVQLQKRRRAYLMNHPELLTNAELDDLHKMQRAESDRISERISSEPRAKAASAPRTGRKAKPLTDEPEREQ